MFYCKCKPANNTGHELPPCPSGLSASLSADTLNSPRAIPNKWIEFRAVTPSSPSLSK